LPLKLKFTVYKVQERLCGGFDIVGIAINVQMITDIKIFSMKLLYFIS